MIKIFYLFLLSTLLACKSEKTEKLAVAVQKQDSIKKEVVKHDRLHVYTAYEKKLIEQGFVDIQTVLPDAIILLPYADTTNVFGQRLYDSISHAFLRPEAMNKLQKADRFLKQQDSTFSFVIFDALRPQVAQYKMWEVVKGTPQQRYVASPRSGSMHNFGCALDVSIAQKGKLLDMGTDYDSFEKIAQPRHNLFFLEKGELSQQQVNNRVFLRKVMRQAGFRAIDSEWWHFNAFARAETRARFSIVK